MSGTTTHYSFPYPTSGDSFLVSTHIQNLAVAIDTALDGVVQDVATDNTTQNSVLNAAIDAVEAKVNMVQDTPTRYLSISRAAQVIADGATATFTGTVTTNINTDGAGGTSGIVISGGNMPVAETGLWLYSMALTANAAMANCQMVIAIDSNRTHRALATGNTTGGTTWACQSAIGDLVTFQFINLSGGSRTITPTRIDMVRLVGI